MSSIKCLFCDRTFATRNGLSKYMAKCTFKSNEEECIIPKSSENILIDSIDFESTQDDLEFNEVKFDSRFSSKKISFKDINFRSTSNLSKVIDIDTNDNFNILAGPLNLSNIDDSSEYLDKMSFELEDNTNILHEFENTLQEYKDLSEVFSDNSEVSKDFQCNSSEDELNPKYNKFLNNAYADLIVLVTKYKLSNAARNAIILFFNKHSNHSTSLLSKNIKQGKLFMNNMESNLSYKKTKVLEHNNTEYFLYHMPLISCIKNILEIPNISQTFALEYKELYKTTKVQFLIFIKVKNVYLFLLIYFLKNGLENIYKEQNNGQL